MIELTELQKAFGVGGLLLLSYFIKIPKLEINIWGWLARTIGDALNANQKKEIDEIRTSLKQLSDDFQAYKKADEELTMDSNRREIIQFSDEIRRGVRHSQEAYERILEVTDAYEKYCDSHPSYINSKAKFAKENIRETYAVVFKENDFL